MATIAQLNVKLVASIGGFATSMKSAASTLNSFGEQAGGIGASVLKFGAVVGAAGLAAAAGLAYLVKGSMESIAETGRLSDRLGITTEKLTGLQYASKLAGIDQESLTTGMEHLLKNLAEAADQGGPAADSLIKMGLSAKQLANESPDQALSQIADGLKAIQNPAERGKAAMDLFGRSGQQLLPLLMEGSKGIAAAQAEAEKLGISFNRVDAAKVEAANQSFVRLQGVIQGAVQKLAIELSPFIDSVTNKLVAMATTGKGAAGYVVDGFEWVVKATANAADYLQLLPAGFHGFRAGALEAISGVLGAIDSLGGGLVKLLNMLPGVKVSWTDTFDTLRQGMDQIAAEEAGKFNDAMGAFQRGDNATKAAKLFDGIRADAEKSAQAIADNAKSLNQVGAAADSTGESVKKHEEDAKKIAETLAELHKAVETFGQTDQQKKLFDLKELGASAAQLGEAQKQLDKLKSLEDAKKKMEDQQREAKSVFDSTRSPMEKYTAQIDKLSDLLNSGTISWDTYGRAVRQARQQLEDTANTQSPTLMQSNSAEAQEYAYDRSRGASTSKVDSDSKALQQQMYTTQYQSQQWLQRISDTLDDSSADPTTTITIA